MAVKNKDGHWIDPKGDAVPVKYIDLVDKKRDRLVTRLVRRADKVSDQLRKLRTTTLADVEKYLAEVEEIYGVKARTEKGNKVLADFSHSIKVEVRVGMFIDFDERLALAKTLIDNCIRRWSTGANDKIMALVEQAFKVDKKGKLDKERILSLRKLKIKDDEWKKAMTLISDSVKVVGSRTYVKFSVRDGKGAWTGLPLDIASC